MPQDRTKSGIGVSRKDFDALMDSIRPPPHVLDYINEFDRSLGRGFVYKASTRRLYLECKNGEFLEWLISKCIPKLPPEDQEFGERILAITRNCYCADSRKYSLNIRKALPWETISWMINRVLTHGTEYFFDNKYKRFRVVRRTDDKKG